MQLWISQKLHSSALSAEFRISRSCRNPFETSGLEVSRSRRRILSRIQILFVKKLLKASKRIQKILKRPESQINSMEEKVDVLADEMAEIALLMKTGQTKAVQDPEKWFFFCGKTGHGDKPREDNPNLLVRCELCGKVGHTIETCWCREVAYKYQGVGIYGARSELGAEVKLRTPKQQQGEEKREPVEVALECAWSTKEVVGATK